MWSMKQRVFWHMQWQDYGVWILLQRNQVITQKEMRIYTFISSISSIFCVWCFFDATSAVTRILWAKISIFETAHEMAVGIFLGLNINHRDHYRMGIICKQCLLYSTIWLKFMYLANKLNMKETQLTFWMWQIDIDGECEIWFGFHLHWHRFPILGLSTLPCSHWKLIPFKIDVKNMGGQAFWVFM